MAVEQSYITACGEKFVNGSYNGISILIREKDGYVNATKLCNQFRKEFRHIKRNQSWHEFYNEFVKEYVGRDKNPDLIYELKKGFSNDYSGIYVHPKLINTISFWVNPKYAVYVSKIMDLINERNQIENNSLDDTIKQLQEENSKLKEQLKQSDKILEAKINILMNIQ